MFSHPKRANISGPFCRSCLLWRMRLRVPKKLCWHSPKCSYTVRPPAVSDPYSIGDIVLILFALERYLSLRRARCRYEYLKRGSDAIRNKHRSGVPVERSEVERVNFHAGSERQSIFTSLFMLTPAQIRSALTPSSRALYSRAISRDRYELLDCVTMMV